MQKKNAGFTLLELMIVVVIISLVAAFGYPSYVSSIRKANISAVQGDLEAAAQAMAAFRSMNFTYANATLGATGVFRSTSPDSGTPQYDLVFANGTATNPTAGTFIIYARPRAGSRMAGRGALGIDQNGQRCWDPASDTTCTPGLATQRWQ